MFRFLQYFVSFWKKNKFTSHFNKSLSFELLRDYEPICITFHIISQKAGIW